MLLNYSTRRSLLSTLTNRQKQRFVHGAPVKNDETADCLPAIKLIDWPLALMAVHS